MEEYWLSIGNLKFIIFFQFFKSFKMKHLTVYTVKLSCFNRRYNRLYTLHTLLNGKKILFIYHTAQVEIDKNKSLVNN